LALSHLRRFEQQGGRLAPSYGKRLEDSLRQAVEQAKRDWREWANDTFS
jgi:hypothetical protein